MKLKPNLLLLNALLHICSLTNITKALHAVPMLGHNYSFASWCNNKPGRTSLPCASLQYIFKMDDEYDPILSTLLCSKAASCQAWLYKGNISCLSTMQNYVHTDISDTIVYLWTCIWISTRYDVYDAISWIKSWLNYYNLL